MFGFIGGSGIYDALSLDDERTESVSTPYGDPSAPITVGTLAGQEIAFVPRHGPDHTYTPTEVPYRANVYALRELGVDRIVSSNAVGGLREELSPQTLVVPDQILDRTKHRTASFVPADKIDFPISRSPYCPRFADSLASVAERATDASVRHGGTYVCIEGPQFATQAESRFYYESGGDVVGMTTVPEAALAREAGLCYATITGVTDYGVWLGKEADRLEEILENAAKNEQAIKRTVERVVRELPAECDCQHADENSVGESVLR
ncbi:MTAP family purine nucleoside phosphorylase [Halorussus halophilus]|uniref:MTAP family purine nucleoside phosphorylase n=1 Tax=Halorussus halophilus TaxID=2650975 RepID=UPI0013014022|nr:MTAP family purine nucleoside phosphorylase [Halorussus halophilus]